LGTIALQFKPADKEQLIQRLNSDQLVYVELNVSSAEVRYARDLSVHWLPGESTTFESDGASVDLQARDFQAEESLGAVAGNAVADDQLSFSGDVLVAEGSAEQIRAALIKLSDMKGVEVKLASAPATSWYGPARRGLHRGFRTSPDAAQPAPVADADADYSVPADFKGQSSIGKFSKAAIQPAPPSGVEEQESLDRSKKRRQRTERGRGMEAGQAGREMPGAGGAYGGGGTLAGDAPAAAATSPSPPRRPTRFDLSETDKLPLKKAESERETEKAKEIVQDLQQRSETAADIAKKAKGIGEAATPSAPKAAAGMGGRATRLQGEAIADQAVGQRSDRDEKAQTIGGSSGQAASAGGMPAPAEKPGAESIVQVARPRLVRILFRVTPLGDASATQQAQPADAASADETPDKEK
jgi:hypothetical protein